MVEDLAQETFLRLFRGLRYFDARAKVSTWIYTIAHRVAIDHLRKLGRAREEPDELLRSALPASGVLDPEAAATREEVDRLVRDGLAQLPDKYRLPLVYAAIDGLDYETIGTMLGVPPGTVKTLSSVGSGCSRTGSCRRWRRGRPATRCRMRCDEAQSELARDPVDAVVRDALASHVASCPACERVRRLYGQIDEVLVHGPAWAAPVEFGRRVAARVPRPAPRRIAARRMLPLGVLDVAAPGLLIAAAGCVAGLAPDVSIVDAVPLTWLCAALSLWIGASYMRRAMRLRDRLP